MTSLITHDPFRNNIFWKNGGLDFEFTGRVVVVDVTLK